MAIETVNLGATPNDGTGTNGREFGARFNRNFLKVAAPAIARKPVMGTLGDSMAGYAGGDQANGEVSTSLYSPIAYTRFIGFDADFIMDSRSPTAANAGQRGHGYAVGGTTVAECLRDQMPRLRANVAAGNAPDALYISLGQNETWFDLGKVDISLAMIFQIVEEVLSMGIIGIQIGIYPHSSKGAATENAYSRHYAENKLRNWANNKYGLEFVSVLDVLKEGDAAKEQSGVVNWKAGFSNDEIHINPRGARAMVPFLSAAFRRVFRPFIPPVFDAMEYSDGRNKYGNYFGAAGLMVGTGGKITNNADPANPVTVTSADMPAGLELIYNQSLGFTITPRIVTIDNGVLRRKLVLDLAGTPTAHSIPMLRATSNKPFSVGQADIYCEFQHANTKGLNGIQISCARMNAGGVGNAGEFMIPGTLNEKVTLRGLRSVTYINQYSQSEPLKFEFGVRAGTALEGSLEVHRMGVFRSDYN